MSLIRDEIRRLMGEDEDHVVISHGTGRMCSGEVFGVACYEHVGKDENGDDQYRHCGIVGTEEDAEKWLMGSTPEKLIRIHLDRAAGE